MKKIYLYITLFFLVLLIYLNQQYKKKLKKLRSESNSCKELVYIPDPSSIKLTKLSILDSLDKQYLQLGKQEMQKHKLIVTGISRDNAKDLPSVIRHIEHIGSLFQDYKVVIFENDSKDGTKAILANWQQNNHNVKILSKDFNNIKRPTHQFLAEARNNYLEEIKKPEYKDFDMMMIIDMDMGLGIDVRGIEDSFSKINQWDAVCSNGIRSSMNNRMYDAFAFRSDEFPWSPEEWQKICEQNDPNNKWAKVCRMGWKNFDGNFEDIKDTWLEKDKLYWKLVVPQIQKKYDINSSLVSVKSCFGGMSFYKIPAIKACIYHSLENDCEHITFHECLREKNHGKIFMNPNQVIQYD